MDSLKIIKASYYNPQLDPYRGTDVTAELSAQVKNGALFYNGIYNHIFPDRFPGIYKRLKIELEFNGHRFIKFYNENEKVNLPDELGKIPNQKYYFILLVKYILGIAGAVIAGYVVWYFGWN